MLPRDFNPEDFNKRRHILFMEINTQYCDEINLFNWYNINYKSNSISWKIINSKCVKITIRENVENFDIMSPPAVKIYVTATSIEIIYYLTLIDSCFPLLFIIYITISFVSFFKLWYLQAGIFHICTKKSVSWMH